MDVVNSHLLFHSLMAIDCFFYRRFCLFFALLVKLQGRLLTIWPAGDRQNIARGTWCCSKAKNTIYILSFFIKKTQMTDPKDIQAAINRKKR